MVVRCAEQCLPGVDHVGVSVAHRTGTILPTAATDSFVGQFDMLQQQFGEGPGVYDPRSPLAITVEDVSTETRWPRFMSAARHLGLRSHLRFEVYRDADSAGFLNM